MKSFKSNFEQRVTNNLKQRTIAYLYEPHLLPYLSKHTYVFDLLIGNTYIEIIEGYFHSEAQYNMRMVKEQYPKLDIRFLSQDKNSKVQGARLRKDVTKVTCAE